MQPSEEKGDKPFRSVYQKVTDQVLAELAKGTAPWRKPWKAEAGLPRNLVSRQAYKGTNVLSLMTAALAAGYESNWWCTYRQALLLGGHVNRGEHGYVIVFYQSTPIEETEEGADDARRARWRPVLRSFVVFNAAQISGVAVPQPPPLSWQPIEAAERIVEAVGVAIHHSGTEAFYDGRKDAIWMPPRNLFDTTAGYYSTALHELLHATGHQSRLDRPSGPIGTEKYAWEEVVAEIGSAMLSVIVGIPTPDFGNFAAYVSAWRRRMQKDATAIAEAAASAQKAVEWLLGKAALPLPQ